MPLFVIKWEGAGIWLIRKPEYLILTLTTKPSRSEVSLADFSGFALISLERGYSGEIIITHSISRRFFPFHHQSHLQIKFEESDFCHRKTLQISAGSL